MSGAARQGDDIDQIIRMAEAGIKPAKAGAEASQGEKRKGNKDKNTRMVYADLEIEAPKSGAGRDAEVRFRPRDGAPDRRGGERELGHQVGEPEKGIQAGCFYDIVDSWALERPNLYLVKANQTNYIEMPRGLRAMRLIQHKL